MSKNYPPGVTGNEPEIAGNEFARPGKKWKPDYGIKKERRAEVTERTDRHIYITDDTGEVHMLTIGSIDSTPAPVGTKGVIQYITGPSYGLWFFKADQHGNAH